MGGPLPEGTLLYTAPPTPQRQPLTDEQINDILQRNHIPALPPEWEDCDFQIARAIERAHGIGDK